MSNSKEQNRIAIYRPGALGDVFCLLQLSPLLRKRYGGLDFYTHESTYAILKDFVDKCDLADLFLPENRKNKEYSNWLSPCGYPFSEGFPQKKMGKHILQYFAEEAGVEIDTSANGLSLLSFSPPEPICKSSSPFYITIQVKTGWSRYKEWPLRNWFELIKLIKSRTGIKIYQIGGPLDPKISGTDGDFLGKDFITNLSAQSWANLHIGLDSVLNHTTNIAWSHKHKKTPAVILFGSTDPTGFGYSQNTNLFLDLPCQPCYKENPEISDRPGGPCLFKHECMQKLTVEQVYQESIKKL